MGGCMKKIELLAPAGNLDCLKVAVDNGADAVYIGGQMFSARAFANNFTNEEIIEGIHYAHIRGCKVYVSINTLIYDEELEDLKIKALFAEKDEAHRKTSIKKGDRICQFRIQLSQKATFWQKLKWLFTSKIKFVWVDHLDGPDRSGFGSTGR